MSSAPYHDASNLTTSPLIQCGVAVLLNSTIQYYDSTAEALCGQYETAVPDDVRSLLISVLDKGPPILEIGFGSGRDGAWLKSQHYQWWGIDASFSMVVEAMRLHPELGGRIALADLRRPLPFEDQGFSGVFCIAALMHLDPAAVSRALNESCRILKEHSPFVLSVPLARDNVDADGLDPNGRYFLPWTQEQWLDAVEIAGFSVEQAPTSNDSMGRKVTWLSLVARKCPGRLP